jgi:hypothetical protein
MLGFVSNRRAPVLLLIVLLNVGCAAVTRARLDDIAEKCDFRADPRFSVLAGKIPLSVKEAQQPPTAAELLNTAKPTPAERNALIALDQENQKCSVQALGVIDRAGAATIGNIGREASAIGTAMDVKLIKGEWSYAEWRQQKYNLRLKTQRIILDYEEAQRAKDEARAAALSAEMMALSQAYLANRPVFTNCTYGGGSANCITH